ncbi:MAG: ferrous iron transport protein B [Candidatus Odinarchaeia archaeon]
MLKLEQKFDFIKVALIGNPNVGKSVVFNNLTGIRQHVGNWPGKTVEKKEGSCFFEEKKLMIIDLPGTYSLSARSIDEQIARDCIIDEKPDVVVDIVDASNLERNLYLTIQLIELGANVVVALNMFDLAERKGYKINIEKLSSLLGVPVIPTVATSKKGMEQLKREVVRAARKRTSNQNIVHYGKNVEDAIERLVKFIKSNAELANKYPVRWLAIKLLENDPDILKIIIANPKYKQILSRLEQIRKQLFEKEGITDDELELFIVDKRYELIGRIIKKVFQKTMEEELTISDMLDKVFLNKYLGIPIFLLIMYGVFQFTFIVAAPLVDLIDWGFGVIGEAAANLISNEVLASFIVDGIIGGLGAVLVFVPNIFFLFFAISLLEDSGYFARAAFVMDKAMRKIGLHGKSFIPMLLGFGCNLPAIMATRSIESEEDRLITILVNPLISCSARLPVYVLIGGAFFGSNAGLIVFSLYMLGIALCIGVAWVFRKTIFKGKTSPFIMELPSYKMPTLRAGVINMYDKGKMFLKKAGGIILAVVIVIWLLSSLPWGVPIEETIIGQIGYILQPIFAPLGFDWRGAVALIFGFLAKEVVVGTFGVILGAESEASLQTALHTMFNPVTAYAFMVFTLIYIPCVAAIAVIWKETRSVKIVALTVGYELALAYTMALIFSVIGGFLFLI